MKLIIDIPKELYKANQRGLEAEEVWDLRIAIKNGTPLDKIRAEIDEIEINGQIDEHTAFIRTGEQVKQMALQIIDKYR